MSNVPHALPPAGWYPDPAGPGSRRYWTGQAWSMETRPDFAPPAHPVSQPYSTPTARVAGALVGATSFQPAVAGYRDAPPAPQGRMGFGEAVATCFRKYADFTGVATKDEYRWFRLFAILVEVAFALVGFVLLGQYFIVLVCIPVLALLVPTYAVIVRRLRDGGHEWWWVLLTVLPFVWIIVIKFLSDPSRPAWPDDGHRPQLHPGHASGA
jgi:uncharacterized membrane protein YhaH (DUF805 family)